MTFILRSRVEHGWDSRQEQGDARTCRYAQAAATPRTPIHAQPGGKRVFCASAASRRGSRTYGYASHLVPVRRAKYPRRGPQNECQQALSRLSWVGPRLRCAGAGRTPGERAPVDADASSASRSTQRAARPRATRRDDLPWPRIVVARRLRCASIAARLAPSPEPREVVANVVQLKKACLAADRVLQPRGGGSYRSISSPRTLAARSATGNRSDLGRRSRTDFPNP